MKYGNVIKKVSMTQSDLSKINHYTRSELSADDVYAFSIVLCDNEVDRDYERFSIDALHKLAKLYVGKPGIQDHVPSTQNQVARTYDAWVEQDTSKLTMVGETYHQLIAKAYIPRSVTAEPLIQDIDAGIKKEVSVGCSLTSSTCSICGKSAFECEHRRGQTYDGKLAHFILSDPIDAYEWSFVAVPAQRAAGVIKSFAPDEISEAIAALAECDLSGQTENIRKLLALSLDPGEKRERQEILEENKKYLEV